MNETILNYNKFCKSVKYVSPLSNKVYLIINQKKTINVNVYLTDQFLFITSSTSNNLSNNLLQISYDNIKGVLIDKKIINLYLNIEIKNEYVQSTFSKMYFVSINLRSPYPLIKALSQCYSSYFLLKNQVRELPVKEKENKNNKFIEFPQLEIPTNFKIAELIQGYKCLIPYHMIIIDNSNHFMKIRLKNLNGYIRLHPLMKNNQISIDAFSFRSAFSSIQTFLVDNNNYLVSLLYSKPYNKKMNLTNDIAQWDGYAIKVIAYPKNEEAGQNRILYCSLYIFLFRKFIPPTFGWCQPFEIFLNFPLSIDNPTNDEIYYSYILETIADSLHFSNKFNSLGEIDNQITSSLFNSMLLNNSGYDFFLNNILSRPKENRIIKDIYLYGMIYTIKLYSMIKAPKDSMIEILFTEKANFINKEMNYETIKSYSIDNILKILLNTMKSNDNTKYYDRHKTIYLNKIYRYLGFCVNNGIFPDLINNDLIIQYGIDNKSSKNEIINLINLTLYDTNNSIIQFDYEQEKIIDSLLLYFKQHNNEKILIDYNKELLGTLIRNGNIMKVFNINEGQLADFLMIILQNSYNLDISIIKNLDIFLYRLVLDTEQKIKDSMIKIIPPLISHYKQMFIDIYLSIESCNCLCDLTNNEKDHSNKMEIFNYNCTDIILNLFQNKNHIYYEKIYFCSLKLFNNLIPTFTYEFIEEKIKVQFFLDFIINYRFIDTKIIKSIFIILANLIKNQPSLLREKFLYEIHKKNMIYFFNYTFEKIIFGVDSEINNEDEIYEKISIFQFLIIFLRNGKNIHEKFVFTFLFEKIKIEKIINDISSELFKFVQELIKRDDLLVEKFIIDLKKKYYSNFLWFAYELLKNMQDIKNEYIDEENESQFTLSLLLISESEETNPDLSFFSKQSNLILSMINKEEKEESKIGDSKINH